MTITAIFSNEHRWLSSNWASGCSRQEADRILLISEQEPKVWGIDLTQAEDDEVSEYDLPYGWSVEEANRAIDVLYPTGG